MMMNKLPDTVKVGGIDYTVIYPYEFIDSQDLNGQHSGCEGWIKVDNSRMFSHGIRDEQMVLHTFLHELLHAVDFVYCGTSFSESQIEMLTRAFFQVLVDNRLYLGEYGKMPKKVKVCGVEFTVVSGYKYVDNTDATSHCDFDKMIIYVGAEGRGETFCEQFQKMAFLSSLIHAMLFMYMSGSEFSSMTESFNSRSFASGIYQTFRDNKIEELFEVWIKKR